MYFKLPNFIYVLVFFTLLLNGCSRDKELVTPGVIADKPLHCYNNVMDEDETTLDAGGSCGTTGAALSSSCGSPADSVFIGYYKYKVTSCLMTINGNGDKVFTVNFSGGYMAFTVNANVYYNFDLYVTSSTYPLSDECQCIIQESHYGTYNLTLGDITIKTNGSAFAVDLCNGGMYPGGTPTSVETFANVQ